MMKTNLIFTLLIATCLTTPVMAVQYNNYEINQQLNQPQLKQLSTNYILDYFSSQQPEKVIEGLLNVNLSPLEREFILFNLLAEISQQPPQDFHQKLVDKMKAYPIQATRAADEGHLPVAIFNLNNKAHGIENIWTAYRTEQQFLQLFEQNIPQAMTRIKHILSQQTAQQRPQWLGIKNSLSALSETVMKQLSEYLLSSVKTNQGLDELISHVGLKADNLALIDKALTSELTHVRQSTLLKLSSQLNFDDAKAILIDAAQFGADRKFSTSLLSQFSNDKTVENFLIEQLGNQHNASSAAFALSQSNSPSLPNALQQKYLQSNNSSIHDHVLLALKLNGSSNAQQALQALQKQKLHNQATTEWLQSFDNQNSGEQP